MAKKVLKNKRRVDKRVFYCLAIIFLIIVLINGAFHYLKQTPQGITVESKEYLVQNQDIEFFYDLTYTNSLGERESSQQIFDEINKIIDEADSFILIDMFLLDDSREGYRNLTYEISSNLIKKKNQNPEIEIIFITDLFNSMYGSYNLSYINNMENAGIKVVFSELDVLRDSNPIYSSFWRVLIKPFGLPNECKFSLIKIRDKRLCMRSIFKLLNFKANHRKVIIADIKNSPGEFVSLLTSANPHDGSSAHSNVALKVKGKIFEDIYYSEKNIVKISREDIEIKPPLDEKFENKDLNFKYDKKLNEEYSLVQFITEEKIGKSIVSEIQKMESGESIEIGAFYLSDRNVVNSLIDASKRGVNIRIILDPNKDAFGFEKNGIPNRQVANELIRKSDGKIQIRWYDTHGEQFHSKIIIFRKKDNTMVVILGSANFTKRNLQGFNLEANFRLTTNSSSEIGIEIGNYFNEIWNNKNQNYTVNYSKYSETGIKNFWKTLVYRFQEFSGMCTY